MLTRCPSCGTTFRLRPDQIAKAQGRVRCGKCSVAFSAVDHRIDGDDDDVELPAPAADVSLPPLPAAAPQFAAQRKRFLAQRDTSPAPSAAERIAHYDDITLPPEPPQENAPAQPPSTGAGPAPAAQETTPAAPAAAPDTTEAFGTTAESPAGAEAGERAESAPEEADEEDEQDEARDDADALAAEAADYLAPAPPPRRWPWIAGTLLLGGALAIQVAYAYRTEIAKRHPEWRPRLEAMCRSLGCVVELPRDADQVSIESSELNPEHARLRLEAHLKNRAAYAQAYPHLELTLTDVRDQAVLRRVFEPRDYLPADAAASFPPQSEIVITLLLDVGESAASGYRVYVFYP